MFKKHSAASFRARQSQSRYAQLHDPVQPFYGSILKARKYKKYTHVLRVFCIFPPVLSQPTNHNPQITTHKSQLTNHYPPLTTHKKGSKSGGISITFFHVSGKNLPKPSEKKVPETAFQAQKQPEKRVYQTNRQLTLSILEKN